MNNINVSLRGTPTPYPTCMEAKKGNFYVSAMRRRTSAVKRTPSARNFTTGCVQPIIHNCAVRLHHVVTTHITELMNNNIIIMILCVW